MALMVSISGIRGIVGKSLTPDITVKYTAAFAEYCKKGTIVVGYDGRTTGYNIVDIVISTLLQMGCKVHYIGMCPTPTIGLAVEHLKAAGGIVVTASHNPIMWNGFKFFGPSGMFLNHEESKIFWSIADEGNFTYASWENQGKLTKDPGFIKKHIDIVISSSFVQKQKIVAKKFKVVVDCVNAAGGFIVPQLLKELGCEVVEMNCNANGVFSHTPEPIPENLTELSKRIVEEKADLGIAVDPDVDRLVLFTEEGKPFVEEYTIVSITKFILDFEKKSGRTGHTVVVNLSTTRAIEDVAKEFDAKVVRTPVGEINVSSCMKENRSIVGGEGSGGIILPNVHFSRDAIVGICLFMQLFADFGGKASELKASLPRYEIVKNKIELGTLDPDKIFKKIHEKYSSERVNTDDGLKIDFTDSWVQIRKSNTEPVVRIIAEAHTKEEATDLINKFKNEIVC